MTTALSPAFAGMNRLAITALMQIDPFPRVRGDEPLPRLLVKKRPLFPPRSRG